MKDKLGLLYRPLLALGFAVSITFFAPGSIFHHKLVSPEGVLDGLINGGAYVGCGGGSLLNCSL